jgi:hypothetical protein
MKAGGQRDKGLDRPITVDELWAALQRALEDLHNAVARVDAGDMRAFDTIAQRLRVVAGTGSGANLLARTAKALGLDLTPLSITDTPGRNADGKPLTFAIMNLPADTTCCSLPLLQVPLSTLMQRTVISVDPHFASEDRATAPPSLSSFTWQELVSTVANKLGPMHVDENIPVWLDDLVRYRAIGMNPAAYALRALAVAVLQCGVNLARAASRPLQLSPHSYIVAGQWLGRLRVWGRLSGIVSMDVLAGGSSPGPSEPFGWNAHAPRVWP